MKILNYEIRKVTPDSEIKNAILDKAEQNAKAGVISASLELRHHDFLLDQFADADLDSEEVQREIRLTKEAIERDEKTINNWKTQLRAINYERR